MEYRLPNFLLVGAARSGTTTTAATLSMHPEIYMSPIKEPKFFSSHFVSYPFKGTGDDFVESFTTKTFEEYSRLFTAVKEETVVGEASVENLYYYEKVIPLIKRYLGDVKILIVLRNPVERAYSAYQFHRRELREELSFEAALEKERERMNDSHEFLWFYRDVGFYFRQVKAYLEAFPRVKVLLYDDLRKNHRKFFREIFAFLEVDTGFEAKERLYLCRSGIPRSRFYQWLFGPKPFIGGIYKLLAFNGLINFGRFLKRLEGTYYSVNLQQTRMRPQTRRLLVETYRDDVGRLQDLLGRDLSHWLS